MALGDRRGITPFPPRAIRAPEQPLAGGGGGPNDPDRAARLRRLEDAFLRIWPLMRSLDDRMRKVETEVAETKGRVMHLPSTRAMVTTMIGGQIALAAALTGILRTAGIH